ncbi:MAG: carbon-nitrogen hydrolase family protein [Ruminococcus sp.]|nr:carbon-nitrogen hydrolase family protein [Ruminococcus sp.]
MKLAMAQIPMTDDMNENLSKAVGYIRQARDCDLIFFPEIQLSPFFPQYEKGDASGYLIGTDSGYICQLCAAARENGLYVSPNVYLCENGGPYDASLWITPQGEIEDTAKMVHIMQAEQFYEQDFYTPSEDGFKVFDTPFGRVGIVICFDRHLPESIRTCALKGAQLVIVPAANTFCEPLEIFEWELRIQAFQNNVFIAMCNRVGREDKMAFCGQSLVISPDGGVISRADDTEQLIKTELDLSQSAVSRNKRPYIKTRRNDEYYRR